MKKIARISVLAALALAASCDKTIDYEYVPFFLLEEDSYSVSEGAGTMTVPVTLYNAGDREVSLTVTATPDSDFPATEGIDYVITEPASGILVFKPGETRKNITVSVVNHPGEFTGTLKFSLALGSGTDGINMGVTNSCSIAIYDHECVSPWLGTWSNKVTDIWGDIQDMSITISDAGENNVTIARMCPGLLTFVSKVNDVGGVISDDGETLVIKTGQETGWRSYGDAIFYAGLNSQTYETASAFADIVLEIDAFRRTITFTNCWGTTNAVSGTWWDMYNAPVTLLAEED